MPILWMEQESPLRITVVSDDGKELASMTVEGVDARDADWRVTRLEDPRPANPVYNKGFRMQRDEESKGERYVLAIEIDEDEDRPQAYRRRGGRKADSAAG